MKPQGAVARRGDYSVREIPHAEAVVFIEQHHYARGASNTSVFAHGLFRGDRLVGAALWLPPTKVCAVSVARRLKHEEWKRVLSLSRLALAPTEPTNAESLFIGRSIRAVWRDSRWRSLVTFADGSQKHTGTIYRATNWIDAGVTKPEPRWVDSTGRQVSRKCGRRSRTAAEMRALGCICVGSFSKRRFVMERAS